ncbi:hypothetical protein BMS3Abin05_02250 [bacterium BMS3Abin05]|nr:hypothetical protein BMS3Abin05_02250 [bacterium BMS3Abin05]GBE28289.1 hypothetical protein BMS3Bbin03_02228 [bacterium BMS3Bbin03]HDK35602.1 PorV/PorQ family protein [Bacteroidota bacterium]HDZ13169.1 PorV/PorQ family protein [Bacteroidota bacterium]
MKFNKLLIILLGITFLLSTTALFAGNRDKVGGAGAQELLIPVGSRAIAMGGASIAMVRGNEAMYWNPAGLAASHANAEVTFSNLQWIAGTKVNYFAISSKFGQIGTMGISAKIFDFGQFEQTTEFETEGTGIMVQPSIVTIGLTYSRQMTDRIFFGVNAKLVRESFMSMSTSNIAFDIGVQYVSSIGVRMGLTLNNFGPMMQFRGTDLQRKVHIPHTEIGASPVDLRLEAQNFELPSTFAIGIGYDVRINAQNMVTVAGNYLNKDYGLDELAAGIEYSFNNVFFIRGGYSGKVGGTSDENLFGFTTGAGIRYKIGGSALMIDYAYRTAKWFSGNQWFTVSMQF